MTDSTNKTDGDTAKRTEAAELRIGHHETAVPACSVKLKGGPASIVILTYNSSKTIEKCLRSVAETLRSGDEVIVVDNNSADNTVAIIESSIKGKKQFTSIVNSENLGFSAGTNVGIRNGCNPFVVLLNPDTVVSEGWLDHLLAHFGNREVGAVGPISDYVAGLQKMGLYQREQVSATSGINQIAEKFYQWYKGRSVETKLLIGFCIAVRRNIFQDLGMLDEDLFLGNDDLELSWRLRANGYRLKVATDTFIHHEGQQSFNTVKKETTSRLVQESTDALHSKLKVYYGDDNVPAPMELWGMEWFTPTAACFNQAAKIGDLKQKPSGKRRPEVKGLVSIVVLTFNELKYTRECIESIRKHTPEPHEVIFVDNASTDGTVKWLRRIVHENANYRLIENKTNLGFAKGCNKGIEASSGEYVLLLNNDVVVTDNWLSGMLECLNSAPDTGIVGPMTNSISGPQKVRDAEYKTMNRMHDYAKSFRERYRYRRIPLKRIVGFCMIFRHQLADRIGLLDESFGTGNFEDDDYCLRSTLAGFRNMIAGDVFIHHYGSRSFIGNRIDYSSSMSGNKKIFDEKWTGIAVDTQLGRKVAAFNFIDRADKFNQRGHLDKAIGMLIEGIKYAPEENALYYQLAEMLLDEKLYKDALEAVNSMPPEAKDDLKRLEIIAYCTEELEAADKYADRILEIDKACAPAWNLKGLIAHKQGDNAVAEGFFKQAITADPGYAASYTNRGMLKWESDRKAEALDLLEKSFILSPTATDSVTLYHSAITALEQFERAGKIFQDAKELHPENKRILFFLIDMLINQGKFEMAMHEVERAMLDIGIDDGMLPAALALRDKVGIKEIDKAVKDKGTLSLCLIVKNEEKHLARCLLSAGPVVDEMIIVDTGSTDRTMDIARAYGAKVLEFPWTNDFSEARNYSLSNAVGDWILVLDADEVISPRDYAGFEKIVKTRPSRPVAYTMITRNYTYEVTSKGWTANDRKYLSEEAGTGWFPSAKVRLFVNDKRIRFQNPVHEFVEASLQKAGIEIKISAIPVHHYGRFDRDKLIEKGKKYFILGKKKIEEMKGDYKALKELAIQASELGEYETSVELWKEAIILDQSQADAFLNIGYAYLKLEKFQEALDSSRRATELDPSMREAALNYAGSEFLIGDIRKAISISEALLQKCPDYPPATLLVAAAYYVLGQKEKGLGFFEQLRKRGFNWTDFLDEQARGAISLGKFDQAFLLLEAAVKTGNINKDTDRLLAECRSKKEGHGF